MILGTRRRRGSWSMDEGGTERDAIEASAPVDSVR
jgi:hypothetical protein